MKKFIKIFSIAAIATLLLAGCKKSLDLVPYTQLGDQTAFQTPERCQLALYGVYDAAQSGFYDPLNGTALGVRGYPFGAAALELSDMRGEDMVNLQGFFQVTYQNNYTPVAPNNVNMWSNLYLLINKANLSIDGFRGAVAKGIITNTVAAQYEAECRFLRALAHHELVINFARPYLDGNGNLPGVPYRDYAVNSDATLERVKAHARDSVKTVYAKMIADLDYAEANIGVTVPITVPGTTSLPTGVNVFRATKAAVIALKMRIKSHMGDWTGAATEGKKLLPALPLPAINEYSAPLTVSPVGGNKLNASPDGAFLNNQTLESIFSIRNDPLDNHAGGNNSAMSQMYGSVAAGGRGLVGISPIIWNNTTWRCDDTRRTLLYATAAGPSGITSVFTKKYIDYINKSDYCPIIRYAEVILTVAEAEARNASGVSTNAVSLLNVLRNRSLPGGTSSTPPPAAYTVASFATKTDLIKAILLERRIEFLAEGRRWADIHRLVMEPLYSTNGIPDKIANGFNNIAAYGCSSPMPALGQPGIVYSDYRFLWPIPQDERAQNPIIAQNPGY